MKNRTKTSLIVPCLLYIAFALLHTSFKRNMFDLGLSWTLSALLPYFLTAVTAFLFARQLGWVLGGLHPLKRKLIAVLSFFALGGIAFGLQPIYEGDFSNTYEELVIAGSDEHLIPEGFSMVALPGCPFCFERIATLNELANKQPNFPIQVVLVKEDVQTIALYEERLEPTINVVVSESGSFLSETVKGVYPSFLFNVDNKVYKWRNEGLGSTAKDWLVSH